jgi:protein phosphatase 4 regulatory subunit 3
LGPVLDVLDDAMPRDNLLTSACLELFEFIKKENIKELVKHLVKNHRERLEKLRYMDTFRDLIIRYDQSEGYTANMEYFLEQEDDVARRPAHPNARMMEHISVDPNEEEYWNTSDDEEDQQAKAAERAAPANATPMTPSKPLVDYPSDEEADEKSDENVDPLANHTAVELKAQPEILKNGVAEDPQATATAVAPLERISEKRRREEEDEDEIGKLMHNKRRNSSSAGSTASVTASNVVRKKKSFSGNAGGGAPKKIAISLSPTVKAGSNGTNARSEDDS